MISNLYILLFNRLSRYSQNDISFFLIVISRFANLFSFSIQKYNRGKKIVLIKDTPLHCSKKMRKKAKEKLI